MPKPDFYKLDQAVAYIEVHPDEWDQANWHCGTKFCLAGHIAKLNGWKLVQDGKSQTVDKFCILVTKNTDKVRIEEAAHREITGSVNYSSENPLYDLFHLPHTLESLKDYIIAWKTKENVPG